MQTSKSVFRPLHWFDRNEQSTVTVGYLVIAMTLYATLSGVWNTGVVVDQKIRTQAVADAAAYSAAARMGAGVNEMAMLNMLALRSRAALAVYHACIASSAVGLAAAIGLEVYYIGRIAASLGLDVGAWVQAGLTAADIAALVAFTVHYAQASLGDLNDVYDKVTEAQETLAESLTDDIHEQCIEFQKYLEIGGKTRTRIYVSHPDAAFYPGRGGDATTYLFEETGYFTRLLMLGSRIAFADAQWLNVDNVYDPPDPKNAYVFPVVTGGLGFFDNFQSEYMPNIMRAAVFGSLLVSTLANAAPQWGYNLQGSDERRMMQVIAAAERLGTHDTFMAKGFFRPLNPGNSVVAVAEAEASNPYKELIAEIPVLNVISNFLPWELWTSMGANYQGRLSRIDATLVEEALGNNRDMRDAWIRNTGGRVDAGYRTDLFLH